MCAHIAAGGGSLLHHPQVKAPARAPRVHHCVRVAGSAVHLHDEVADTQLRLGVLLVPLLPEAACGDGGDDETLREVQA